MSMNKTILDKLSKLTEGEPKLMGLGDAMAIGLRMLDEGDMPCELDKKRRDALDKSCKNRMDDLNDLFPLRHGGKTGNLFK